MTALLAESTMADTYTPAQITEAEFHRQALDRWHGPYLPKLSDDDLERCHDLIDQDVGARVAAADAHRALLARRARYLAGEVKAYRVTLADAEQKLARLAEGLDPDFPVARYLVRWPEACEIVRASFAEVIG